MRLRKPWGRTSAEAAASRTLPFPASRSLRTAIVGEIRCFDNTPVFADNRLSDLFAYEPQILAAPPGTLVRLAEYVFHGAWNAASVDTALFALTVPGQTPIAEEQRLLAWRAFRVPLYELLIDLDAGVLAAECEAHEGWHIQHPQLRFDLQAGKIVFQKNGISVVPVCTGLTADGLDGVCGCGAETPLLRNVRLLQRVEQRPVRQVARA